MKHVKQRKPVEQRMSIFEEPKILRLKAIELLKTLKQNEKKN